MNRHQASKQQSAHSVHAPSMVSVPLRKEAIMQSLKHVGGASAFKVPDMPDVIILLEREANSRYPNARKFAEIIESNNVITGEILSIVKSPTFLRHMTATVEIKTIHHVINLIGIQKTYRLAVAAAIRAIPAQSTLFRSIIDHSFDIAVACAEIAGYVQGIDISDAYLFGLFRDAGAIGVANSLQQKYERYWHHLLSFPASGPLLEEQELMNAIGEMTENVSKHVDTHFELAQALESNPEKAPLISAHLKKANRLLSHEVKDGKQRVDATRARLVEHKKHTMTDLLTRLHNETHLAEFLPVIVKRNQTSGKRILLALIDVDHFAEYNADYGHHRGDSLLRGYAKILAALGEGSHAWRMNADEFVLTMVMKPDTPVQSLIKRLHNQLTSIHFKESHNSASVPAQAVTMLVDCVKDHPETTLNRLYQLMQSHRNQGSLVFTPEASALL